jgi:hypothetical protein
MNIMVVHRESRRQPKRGGRPVPSRARRFAGEGQARVFSGQRLRVARSDSLLLARSRRCVLLIDAGEPPAAGIHVVLSRDDVASGALGDVGR